MKSDKKCFKIIEFNVKKPEVCGYCEKSNCVEKEKKEKNWSKKTTTNYISLRSCKIIKKIQFRKRIQFLDKKIHLKYSPYL